MPIETADSCKMQWRYKASTIAGAAYQRHGSSQSGSTLIVWPHIRHRNRCIHTVIHTSPGSPRTCREYRPWPTTWRIPSAFRAACPQNTQCIGRVFSRGGAPELRAHSCSTEMARLCRMINSLGEAMAWAQSGKERAQLPPFSFPKADHRNQISDGLTTTGC